MGLIFTVMSAVLAMIVRAVIRWTRLEDQLITLSKDMQELVEDKDKTHKEILNQMREDRNATNERLTFLERHVWPAQGRRRQT